MRVAIVGNFEFLLSWVRGYYTRNGDLSHAERQALSLDAAEV